ncbi:protein pelota [Pancytospora epiphaga]|nr:protein pelota [Pancytospora epiphaga]
MKIVCNTIESRTNSGSLVLLPSSADDLYVLSSIIAEEDTVEAYTTRKLSLDGGRTQQKVTVKLAIKVESTVFDLDDGIMSLKGKVCRENEYITQGLYHTIHINLGNKFELWKPKWSRRDVHLIYESTKEVPHVVFVTFYDKECVVSNVSSNSIKTVFKGEIKSKNFKPTLGAVVSLKEKTKVLVIASFSVLGDEFYKVLSKENKVIAALSTTIKLKSEYKGLPNSRMISRVLSDSQYSKSFKEIAYVEDLREIEEFFLAMTMGSKKVCVGLGEIQEAFEYGAIKILFITDALYRPRTVEERRATESIISQAMEIRARVCVIPMIHESGERLHEMGGMAGILQFVYK